MQRKLLSILMGLILVLIFLEFSIRISAHLFIAFQENLNHRHAQSRLSDGKNKTLSIVAFGESTTAVAANENNTLLVQDTAYPVYLEKFLNDKHSQYQFEVTNKGIMSGDTKKITFELKEYFKDHNPNIVVVMMGMKDIISSDKEKNEKNKINEILKHSSIYKLITLFIEEFKFRKSNANDSQLVANFEDLSLEFQTNNFRAAYEGIYKQFPTDTISDELLRKVFKGQMLAFYFMNTGQYQKAEAAFNKSVNETGHGYFLLADFYERMNQPIRARKVLTEYQEKHANNPFAYKDLIRHYLNDKNFKGAEKILRLAKLNNLGKNRDLLLAESLLEKEKGHFDKGIELLINECGIQNPASFDKHRIRKARDVNGRIILRKADIEFYMEKDNYEECVYHLSDLYYLAKKYDLAEKNLLYFNQIDSGEHFGFGKDLLRKVYEAQGKIENALDLLKTMNKRKVRLGEYFALVNFYKNTNHQKEIKEIYDTIRINFPQTSEHYREIYKMTREHGARLILMQYPTFSLDFLKAFTKDLEDVYYVSNENIFDNAPKINYFFEPRFPYHFNHYTNLGAKTLAQNLALEIHKGLQEGKL